MKNVFIYKRVVGGRGFKVKFWDRLKGLWWWYIQGAKEDPPDDFPTGKRLAKLAKQLNNSSVPKHDRYIFKNGKTYHIK